MNERLEQLKKQAVNHAEEVFDYHGKDYREIVMEKFAELIVKECVEIVDDEGCGEGGSIRAIEKIKQHFRS